MSAIAERVEKELGGEHGFWKSSTSEVLTTAIEELMKRGWTEEEATDLVYGVYGAACEEYGD